MDFHIDREIRLSEETEYKSLYSWSLQESSRDGKQIGSKQIPWPWSVYFTASELRYSRSIRLERSDESEEKVGLYKSAEESESISATLHPGICEDGKSLERETSFSMFGTGRTLNEFSLRISRLDDTDSTERCNMWGCVSYTSEIDFRDETQEDVVEIHIWLSSGIFDDLRDLARNKSADMVRVRLNGVSGFYSEWSPAVSTDRIKILASGKEQIIALPAGCDIGVPRLGTVAEFEFTAVGRTRLNPKQDLRPVDIGEVFADVAEEREPLLTEDPIPDRPDPSGVILAQLVSAERAIRGLSRPIWIIAALVAVLLFK